MDEPGTRKNYELSVYEVDASLGEVEAFYAKATPKAERKASESNIELSLPGLRVVLRPMGSGRRISYAQGPR